MTRDTYALSASDIATMEATQKIHFLNPNAQCTNRSLGDATGITGFGFHITETQPGHDTTEHHMHFNEDECVYVLSGTATARIGDEVVEISAGSFLGFRKGGLPHSMTNTGTDVLKCIIVGQRLDNDVVDYPVKKKRMFRTVGLPWKVVDFAAIKDRLTGK